MFFEEMRLRHQVVQGRKPEGEIYTKLSYFLLGPGGREELVKGENQMSIG